MPSFAQRTTAATVQVIPMALHLLFVVHVEETKLQGLKMWVLQAI